jgi:hypothetical protein
VDDTKLRADYHWPMDVAETLDRETLGAVMAVAEEFVRGA